ncbi:splicing regulatory glutamine/lysine-rich protein 1 isoform X3 [Eucyclogobius newberryi]|uniref:splicing regulatory glutamine/lysine-rich protein 1 isoform X3 n=1 Tax=Eucyclogobius newberryi TaxID=166745 RepID=UPI003B5CA803
MVHDQYLTSTGKIPEEAKALSLLAPFTPIPSLISGGGLLPIPTPAPLQNLNLPFVNRMSPCLEPIASTQSQPPLMGNVDPTKVDEIRRTVYVGNLNSQTTTADQLLEFFKQVGDVKFVRMAGDETQPTRFAFVEFVDQESVARALTFNGVMFGDRPLKVNHSNNAIVKPPELTPQAAAKELENVMRRVREAQSTIAAAIEPDNKKSSSSWSRRSRRSRSRSGPRKKRSRSKHSRSSQKVWPSESHSSRGNHRRRSRSKGRCRSRGQKRRTKERSQSLHRKPTSPSLKRSKKERKRERSRERKEKNSTKRNCKDGVTLKSKRKSVKAERSSKREKKRAYISDREASSTPSEGASSPLTQHNGSYRKPHASMAV